MEICTDYGIIFFHCSSKSLNFRLKQFTDRWRKVVSHKKIKEERIRDIITSLSLANTAQNHFYDPNKPLKLPISRRPPDEELTIKFAKIKLKQSKHQRLARKCFDLWYNATKRRVEQRKFLEKFFQAQAATQEKEKSFIVKRKRNYMIPFKAPPVFGVPQTSAEMLQGTPRTEKGLEPGSFATMSAKRPRLVAMLEKNRKRRSYLNSTEIREFQDVKKEIDEFQGIFGEKITKKMAKNLTKIAILTIFGEKFH